MLTDGYGTGTEILKATQLATDKFATLPTRRFADSVSALGENVWRYYFSWVSPEKRSSVPGAIHTSEIPYVFGNHSSTEQCDNALSEKMIARWLNFSRTGNPNSSSLPIWPRWVSGEKTLW
ncbi:carboxylesterase family protein [Enterobacter hormaechei]|uniref:carboxylesterase family protein n=1 Tax=Enterobacter hormaechei TaxID=158836 RepID=UPI0032D9D80D